MSANEKTRFHNGIERPQRSVLASFEQAWPEIEASMHAHPQMAVLLVAVGDRATHTAVVESVPHDLPVNAVVGRHACCDLVLPDMPSVSLRHALVRATRTPGVARLRVIDLNTPTRIADGQGRPCGAVSGDRHVLVALAGYHLFALDVDALRALDTVCLEDAWAQVASDIASATTVQTAEPTDPGGTPSPLWPGGSVTQMGGASWLGEEPPGALAEDAPESTRDTVGALFFPGVGVHLQLSAQMLVSGVLMGRYARCQIPLRSDQDATSLSRVHGIILSDATGLWLVDTASTNGIQRDGVEVRAVRLSDGDEFVLGKDAVRMVWVSRHS